MSSKAVKIIDEAVKTTDEAVKKIDKAVKTIDEVRVFLLLFSKVPLSTIFPTDRVFSYESPFPY
jgi:hypothetical protein